MHLNHNGVDLYINQYYCHINLRKEPDSQVKFLYAVFLTFIILFDLVINFIIKLQFWFYKVSILLSINEKLCREKTCFACLP